MVDIIEKDRHYVRTNRELYGICRLRAIRKTTKKKETSCRFCRAKLVLALRKKKEIKLEIGIAAS